MEDEPIDLTMDDERIDLALDDNQPVPVPMDIDEYDDLPRPPPAPFAFPRQLLFYPPEHEEVLVVSPSVHASHIFNF
jgi:hypothetical protein